MLTKEENRLVTHSGAGTPMGDAMRRYWLPALLSEDLPEPDCAPVRVKLLGEELVAFRDTSGRVGLLEEFCAHRCASLFLGRNEQDGLRCVYHGWKYDVEGNCVDMPNEPPENRFQEKVHLPAYPCEDAAGVVWAYLGPPETKPPLPDFEWFRMPETHRFVSKTWQQCNYLQAMEGGFDTVHSSFLHNNRMDQPNTRKISTMPRLDVERTPYGFQYAGVFKYLDEERDYVSVYQFVMPFHQLRPSQIQRHIGGVRMSTPLVKGHIWVPIDDQNTWTYNWMYSADPDVPFTPEFIEDEERNAGRSPTDGEYGARRIRTRANDWLIDREMQRTKNFTGIPGQNNQDLAVQESMGPVVDRSREHLGTTDRAVITLRQSLLDAVRDVAEGIEPAGVDPVPYRSVRPVEETMPHGAAWQETLQAELVARR